MNTNTIFLNIPQAQEDKLLALAAEFQEELENRQGYPLAKSQTLTALKNELHQTLMVQEGFAEIWQQHGQESVLYLNHLNTAIRNLPWRLATSERPFLKLAKTTQKQMPLHLSGDSYPLKVLVMVAAPEGTSRLDYEKEELQIFRAFAPLLVKGLVEVHFTDDGSLENLVEKLAEKKYHILHFTGHGKYNKEGGFLALEDPNTGGLKKATAAELNEILTNAAQKGHEPNMVVLSACQTAQGAIESDLSGVADALLLGGTPAVIAMAASIMDNAAIVFATALYEKLAKNVALTTAFQAGYIAIRQYEVQRFEAAIKVGQTPSQWLIPQLLMSKKVTHLMNPSVEIEPIDFEKEAARIQGKKALLLKERWENYVFIGRRREKHQIREALNTHKTILLQGQGGVGKTAFTEHLVMRLLANNPNRKVFVLNEKQPRAKDLFNRIIRYLGEEKGVKNVGIDVEGFEKLEDKFQFLLKQVEEHCEPIFIFDNVESFQIQEKIPQWNVAQYEDVLSVLTILHQSKRFPVLVTGRYAITELEDLEVCPMNTVAFGDFFRKCCQLNLRQLGAKLHADTDEIPINKTASFENIVETLHQTFGGNYRALEFFDELYMQKRDAIFDTIKAKKKLPNTATIQAVLAKMSKNLAFEGLLNCLDEKAKDSLFLLAHFAIPVFPMAIGAQRGNESRTKSLKKAVQLTLAEAQTGREGQVRYYVVPLVKELLIQHIPSSFVFDAKVAGDYHRYVFDEDLEENTESEFIQAFEQYYVAGVKEKVGEIGEELSRYYYGTQQYYSSFHYGKRTVDLLGTDVGASLHNRLGLLYQRAGDLDTSLKHLEQALAIDRYHKDHLEEGSMLNNISQIYYAKGEYDKALVYLKQALAIQQSIRDHFGEGFTLNNLATTTYAKGDYDSALIYLKQSLAIKQSTEEGLGEGTTLNNISQIYFAKGEYDKALVYLEQSLVIQQSIGDRSGEGITLNNISQIYDVKGEYDKSLAYLEQSLTIAKEVGNRKEESTVLNNIGQIYSAKGEYDKSLAYLEQSLVLRQEIGDRKGQGIALNNISQIYDAKGDYDKSLAYLEQSLTIAKEIGDRSGEGTMLNNISQIYDAKGDCDSALVYLEQSLMIAKEIGDRSGEGTVLNNISQIYSAKGEYDKSLVYLEQSLTIVKEIGDRLGEGRMLNNISQIYDAKRDYDSALAYLEQSLTIQQALGDSVGMAATLNNLGGMCFDKGDYEKAIGYLMLAYGLLQQMGSPNVQHLVDYLEAIIEKIGEAKFQAIVQKMRE